MYARTERAYLKRYRGETNTQLTMLLDASASMGYGSQQVNKLDYARYLAASVVLHVAISSATPSGIVVFDDEVRQYVPPSARHGQFMRVLHAIEKAEPGARTDFEKPFVHCMNFLRRRGILVVISDFYADPERVISTMVPLRSHGNELILFHILDPQEIRPAVREPVLMIDMETEDEIEVTPEYLKTEYPGRSMRTLQP